MEKIKTYYEPSKNPTRAIKGRWYAWREGNLADALVVGTGLARNLAIRDLKELELQIHELAMAQQHAIKHS